MVARRRATGVTRQRVHASSVCGSLLCEVDVEEIEVQAQLYQAGDDGDGVDVAFREISIIFLREVSLKNQDTARGGRQETRG